MLVLHMPDKVYMRVILVCSVVPKFATVVYWLHQDSWVLYGLRERLPVHCNMATVKAKSQHFTGNHPLLIDGEVFIFTPCQEFMTTRHTSTITNKSLATIAASPMRANDRVTLFEMSRARHQRQRLKAPQQHDLLKSGSVRPAVARRCTRWESPSPSSPSDGTSLFPLASVDCS